jgi:transposase-like protein
MSSSSASAFAGFRFPREVISVAVRWYLRYGPSYRDVEELLAERGVNVDHVTVYRWVSAVYTGVRRGGPASTSCAW